MNKRKIIIVGICVGLLLSLTVSAVLLDFLAAKQDGYININGHYCLSFDEQPMNNLVIPLDITNMSAGDYINQSHIIDNPGNKTFNVTFQINNSWFDSPTHDYYGFTYGITGQYGFNYTNSYNIVIPNETFEFYFWYNVDELMITPNYPLSWANDVHTTIWVNATIIE